MDRKDFFFGQRLKENELDAAFDQVEQADWNRTVDRKAWGILAGGQVISDNTHARCTVQKFTAYDKAGRRLVLGSDLVNMSYATATDGTSTVPPGGNERWITLVARFGRSLSTARTDGAGNTVQYNRAEALSATGDSSNIGALQILKGTAVPVAFPTNAVRPSVSANDIVLCDILLPDTGIATDANYSTARTDRYAIRLDQAQGSIFSYEAETAIITGLSGNGVYVLFSEFGNDADFGVKSRIYVHQKGIVFTTNASWDPYTQKWSADGSLRASKIQIDTDGIHIYVRSTSLGAGWDDTKTATGWDSYCEIDQAGNMTANGSCVTFASFYQWFGNTTSESTNYRGGGFSYPRAFPSTPSSVTLTLVGTDQHVTAPQIFNSTAWGATMASQPSGLAAPGIIQASRKVTATL